MWINNFSVRLTYIRFGLIGDPKEFVINVSYERHLTCPDIRITIAPWDGTSLLPAPNKTPT